MKHLETLKMLVYFQTQGAHQAQMLLEMFSELLGHNITGKTSKETKNNVSNLHKLIQKRICVFDTFCFKFCGKDTKKLNLLY